MTIPVDRTQPDTGGQPGAELRRVFMQLLHDANGLGACTKAGAVAHLNFPVIGNDLGSRGLPLGRGRRRLP